MQQSEYSRTFTAFSGADIVATLGGQIVGTLQAITYSVTREKAPIYVMGDPNPKAFARGKRGIAGSLVFTVLDRDALAPLKENLDVHRHGLNTTNDLFSLDKVRSVEELQTQTETNTIDSWKEAKAPRYSDEILPFDITINFMNEYGQASTMTIYGVEILNEGMGMSIDDITTEKACTFIARDIREMEAQTDKFK